MGALARGTLKGLPHKKSLLFRGILLPFLGWKGNWQNGAQVSLDKPESCQLPSPYLRQLG